MKVCLLAGGTGGAKLAVGFQRVLDPGSLSVITNTGDDIDVWGLYVSPDTDAVLYRLAGIFNEATGWGIEGDTFAVLDMLRRYGEQGWFALGDRDLAMHILRTSMLGAGRRLTESAVELARRLGVEPRIYPMLDDPVRTQLDTDLGRFSLQEYFVRERTGPRVVGIEFEGLERARPSPEAKQAVEEADLVVIGPSNPLISIAPILSLVGRGLEREKTIVVTPIIEGRSLKGPTVEMLASMGRDPSPEGVARLYRHLAGWFVLDSRDAHLGVAVQRLGYSLVVCDTLMDSTDAAQRVAASILDAATVRA